VRSSDLIYKNYEIKYQQKKLRKGKINGLSEPQEFAILSLSI